MLHFSHDIPQALKLPSALKAGLDDILTSRIFVKNPKVSILPTSEDIEREFNRRYRNRFDLRTFTSRLGLPNNSVIGIEQSFFMDMGHVFILDIKTNVKRLGPSLRLRTKLAIPKNPNKFEARLVLMEVRNQLGGYSRRKGIGTKVFCELVGHLQNLGYQKISAEAFHGTGYNGYYTWPRLGFDRHLTPDEKQILSDKKLLVTDEGLAETLLDVMKSHAGRTWWRRSGTTHEVEFDLTPDSKSFATLNAYLREKRLQVSVNA